MATPKKGGKSTVAAAPKPAGVKVKPAGGATLDRNQDFGEVFAGGEVKYEQAGKLFNGAGEEVLLGAGKTVGENTVADYTNGAGDTAGTDKTAAAGDGADTVQDAGDNDGDGTGDNAGTTDNDVTDDADNNAGVADEAALEALATGGK